LASEGARRTGRGRGSDSREAGNQQEGNQRAELTPSPVAEALIPDPAQPPPDTTVLQGILGRSDKEGYWRVYFSSSLKEYVEFKAEDALYSDPISKEESPLGVEATRVWLKQDARMMCPYGYPGSAAAGGPPPGWTIEPARWRQDVTPGFAAAGRFTRRGLWNRRDLLFSRQMIHRAGSSGMRGYCSALLPQNCGSGAKLRH